MAREFPLWVIVALPWAAALVALVLAPLLVRVLGPRRAAVFTHYLALGASALALLFSAQAVQHLLMPDPRQLAHTGLVELLPPVTIGELRVDLALVGDRLSISAALVIAAVFVLARIFITGPTGQRELGFLGQGEGGREGGEDRAAVLGLRRLGVLGLLEGAASVVVLAGNLGLAALGWAILGIGAAAVVARGVDDERRASAATRVLAASVAGDLALGAAAVVLVVAGIGLGHTELWAPGTGERLYAVGLLNLPTAELVAFLLISAALLRATSLVWASNSLAEALLDAVVVSIPAGYLLVRYQRVLGYAPTVLAGLLVLGMALALVAVAVALVRPARGLAYRSARPGSELGLAGTGLAWVGLIAMALGVGAWRTALLLLLAQALGRLGLRLALLVARADQLPPYSAQVGRVLCWAVAGVAPGLGFVAIAQTLVDVLTRTSLLGPGIAWVGAAVVLLVGFAHAAAVARLWYESLERKPGVHGDEPEDGLDFGPLALALLGLLVLGIISLSAWFGVSESVIAWLDRVLPLGGGHAGAQLGIRPGFLDALGPGQVGVARRWIAGSSVLVALVTGFAWMWARDRFHRANGGELSSLARALELVLAGPRKIVWTTALIVAGLTELAARGVSRGVFEEGPRIAKSLGRDAQAGLAPRVRKLALGGPRQALLGLILGLVLLLGWLYAKPEVASVTPSDDYGFGGLRPQLIRAGGKQPPPNSEPAAVVDPDREAAR